MNEEAQKRFHKVLEESKTLPIEALAAKIWNEAVEVCEDEWEKYRWAPDKFKDLKME